MTTTHKEPHNPLETVIKLLKEKDEINLAFHKDIFRTLGEIKNTNVQISGELKAIKQDNKTRLQLLEDKVETHSGLLSILDFRISSIKRWLIGTIIWVSVLTFLTLGLLSSI